MLADGEDTTRKRKRISIKKRKRNHELVSTRLSIQDFYLDPLYQPARNGVTVQQHALHFTEGKRERKMMDQVLLVEIQTGQTTSGARAGQVIRQEWAVYGQQLLPVLLSSRWTTTGHHQQKEGSAGIRPASYINSDATHFHYVDKTGNDKSAVLLDKHNVDDDDRNKMADHGRMKKNRRKKRIEENPGTWDDGDGFECTEDAEGAQSGQIADLDGQGGVSGKDDDKVQPIPRTPKIRQPIQDQSFGHGFNHHFARVNAQEHVPGHGQTKCRNKSINSNQSRSINFPFQLFFLPSSFAFHVIH